MSIYIVRPRMKKELTELRKELESGKISKLQPIGETLSYGLNNARVTNDRYVLWIEVDYCSPPLAMEKVSVLDKYFDDITVEPVRSEEEGWNRINNIPQLWT